ncbi:14368_t:CDS:1, partial [Racocetra fulgida]
MSYYIIKEYTELVKIYFKRNSLEKTANIFHIKYLNKFKPASATIYNLVNKFTRTGNVADDHHSGCPISATVLQENPQQLTNKLATKINISPF